MAAICPVSAIIGRWRRHRRALDPTIVNILRDLDTEVEFRALTALAEGARSARATHRSAETLRRYYRPAELAANPAARL